MPIAMDIFKDIFKDHVCKFLGKCLMHSDYSINDFFYVSKSRYPKFILTVNSIIWLFCYLYSGTNTKSNYSDTKKNEPLCDYSFEPACRLFYQVSFIFTDLGKLFAKKCFSSIMLECYKPFKIYWNKIQYIP